MKSIKPGRRRSRYNAVGAVIGIVFGIIWTIAALSMGAPFFFPLFGLVFIGMGVYNAVYNYRNATSENRYSEFDITDENEEPDPLNERYGAKRARTAAMRIPFTAAGSARIAGQRRKKATNTAAGAAKSCRIDKAEICCCIVSAYGI